MEYDVNLFQTSYEGTKNTMKVYIHTYIHIHVCVYIHTHIYV